MFGKAKFKKHLEGKWQDLYRMAYAWSHDIHIAHDLVQETMSKALAKKQQLRKQQALDAWLFKILANCWYDYCRSNKKLTELSEENERVNTFTPEMDHNSFQTIKIVRAAISQLPMNQRQVVTLVDLQEMKYNEVSEILDIPVGTVMSRLCRARTRLKNIIEEMDSNHLPKGDNVRRIK